MSFELLPDMTAWFIAFATIAAIGLIVAFAATTATVVDLRQDRLARKESIPTYYRRLAFSH